MIIKLIFKTPDVLDYALEYETLEPDEAEEIKNFVNKYLKYGETLKVEFDTVKKTAIVKEQ